ncbi:MAG: hypothetical protein LQ343_007216 [Gyalolechia ehrenbergii]|nr:MAG: hypothetical protein LQ343_007216 [Gyalolechia ehrenbergii]
MSQVVTPDHSCFEAIEKWFEIKGYVVRSGRTVEVHQLRYDSDDDAETATKRTDDNDLSMLAYANPTNDEPRQHNQSKIEKELNDPKAVPEGSLGKEHEQ